VTETRKTKLLALDAQDFHALIERMPDPGAHVHRTAKARLANTEQARKGDLAAGDAQAAHADKPADE
jgi:voltage-gated potassium channel